MDSPVGCIIENLPTDNSWSPNVLTDVVAQEEKHKGRSMQTMSGRKTIVLSSHCWHRLTRIETWASLSLFRGKLGWFAQSSRRRMCCFVSLWFSFLFCWPSLMPLREKQRCYLQGGMCRMRGALSVVLTWYWEEKSVNELRWRGSLCFWHQLQEMTESRRCLSLFCLSEIAASLVIRNTMFDSGQKGM